jgi:DNA-binding XRE family transcriptional regulator
MNIKKHIGNKLRAARMKAGFTQTKAAELIGINRATVVNIENGRQQLTIVNLLSFSLLYDIEPKKLLPKLKDFKK